MLKRELKLFVIFSIFVLIKSHPLNLNQDEFYDDFTFYSFESFSNEKLPLTIEKKLQNDELDDFCYLSSEEKTCGCSIFDELHVLTSVECLKK